MFANAEIGAICIDLDNTLWPVEEVIVRAERVTFDWLADHYPQVAARHDIESLRLLGKRVATEFPHLRHDLSHLRKLVFVAVAEDCGYGPELADQAFEVFFTARCEVSCYADVEPGLARLAAAFPLLALTNGNACLDRCGVADYFVGCVYARDVGAAKPRREIFAAATQRLGLDPAAILHVGDDPVADVSGAAAAGMQTVWLNRSGQQWQLSECAPDGQARDFDELLQLLGVTPVHPGGNASVG